MSNTYTSIASIIDLVGRTHTLAELTQALADLSAMFEEKNISEYQYENVKKLIEEKIKRLSK